MTNFQTLAAAEVVNQTTEALSQNGISVRLVSNSLEALVQVKELIPPGSSVMTMTSVTLADSGIVDEINKSGNYSSVRQKLSSMDRATQNQQMQEMGAAPAYVIGSPQAITQDGQLVFASNTGSQLPAYAYGSSHVVFVASTKKIVTNLDEAMKRIYDHVLPLESERAKKAYGALGSFVSKILIINREVTPDRIHLILVNQDLGF